MNISITLPTKINTNNITKNARPLQLLYNHYSTSAMARMEVDDELTAEIKAQVEEWSTNSTECFNIDLLRGNKVVETFTPDFTYPIFGEEEAIFGYRDLSINLSFAAHNLRPYLSIEHGRVFKAQGDVRPTDIKEALADFLPEAAFSEQSRDAALTDADAASFQPPGEKVHGYEHNGQQYEIWCASLADGKARELLENMQILVPMFIEGGSILQLEQDWSANRWKLFLLYQVDSKPAAETSPYMLVGYGTSYRIFTLPDRQAPADTPALNGQDLLSLLPDPDAATTTPASSSSPLDLPSRERLSQFLILPPFQGAGHGRQLYTTMYTHLTAPANVLEFTVEDPNEAFDDLRDLCDLLYLRAHNPSFAALRVNTDIPAEKLASDARIPDDLIVDGSAREAIRKQTKIMPRQFDRLVEMHTLSFIPPLHRSRSRLTRKERASNLNDKAFYLWRLYAKKRLFVHNRDQLVQVEREERVDRLEAVVDSVLEGYGALLEKAGKYGGGKADDNAVEGAKKPAVRKRKVVDEEDEEDEENEDEEVVIGKTNGTSKKKPKV